jgi:hypothetical protein
MDDFPIISVRSYSDLITALRAVKNYLQLSNEAVEDLAGITRGHWDKVAGPCPTKKAGAMVLDALLGALAIQLIVQPDPDAAAKVAGRWTRRNECQIRDRRVTQAMLDRCRPVILAEFARKGAIASAKARRRAQRRNGHANGHAAAK